MTNSLPISPQRCRQFTDAFIARTLSGNELRVVIEIEIAGNGDFVELSYARLAELTGLRLRSVLRILSRLQAGGIVSKACGAANAWRVETDTAHWRPATARYGGLASRAAVVERLGERDGLCCAACGATDGLQVDHILPTSKGGTNTLDNFQLLCGPCNIDKGAAPTDYREQVTS